MNQAIALKPDGIALFADAASLQDPIKAGVAQGIKFVGLHAAGLPGPQPDLHLVFNIEEDPREMGKAEADWAIADFGRQGARRDPQPQRIRHRQGQIHGDQG